jgi:hypothetical protein
MQADVDEVMHVRLEGPLASLLAKVDPKLHEKCLECDKKGKPIMCVKLKKAPCGTLEAAMSFWKDLSAKLVSWGCEINPCDWCVANRMDEPGELLDEDGSELFHHHTAKLLFLFRRAWPDIQTVVSFLTKQKRPTETTTRNSFKPCSTSEGRSIQC